LERVGTKILRTDLIKDITCFIGESLICS